MIPDSRNTPEPIQDIKICPYCGKWSDAQTGFPFLFRSHRMRYHAHPDCHDRFTALHDMFDDPPFGPKPDQLKWMIEPPQPDPDRASTDPTPQDRKINPAPKIRWIDDYKFYISDLATSGSGALKSHELSIECKYCHRIIGVFLWAPKITPKYVKDEACRLAVIEHLRNEHPASKKKPL
jgi:hypothetical protein